MSENSPRWPGADGAPGLDFSPWRRKPTDEATADGETAPAVSPTDAPASEDGAPVSPTTPARVSAGSAVSPSPVPERAVSPASSASPAKMDESMYRSGTGATRLTPTASERAASTAKEWATTPIPGVAPMTPAAAPVPIPAPSGDDTGTMKSVVPPAPKRTRAGGRRTRKARLRLARIDPWSVMKTTFLFSIAFGIMLVVATFVVWSVLSGSGAISAVNEFLNTALGDQNTQFDIGGILSLRRVLGFAAIIAAIDVVILTALATLAAFLYNLAATVMGGLEVTLAED